MVSASSMHALTNAHHTLPRPHFSRLCHWLIDRDRTRHIAKQQGVKGTLKALAWYVGIPHFFVSSHLYT